MQSSNQEKDLLFGVDFDFDQTIEIECKRNTNYVHPGEKYPRTFHAMKKEDFGTWNVSYLQTYLADRGINRTGTKDKLVLNAFSAFVLDLPVISNDAMQAEESIKQSTKQKLVLENGLITLPDPSSLEDGWFEAPANLPNLTHEQVMDYLTQNEAGKAFKGGKSLLSSEHVFNVMTNNISPNIQYCFVKGSCYPEQQAKEAYTVWICLQKTSAKVINAECGCVAGVSGICKHSGALLWFIEEQVRLGTNLTCTSKPQKWHIPSKKQRKLHGPSPLVKITIKKPKVEKILLTKTYDKNDRSKFDPRAPEHRVRKPISTSDVDHLKQITNGNCGLVLLLQKSCPDIDINNVATEEIVETTDNVETPKSILNLVEDFKINESNWQNNMHKFTEKMHLSKPQIDLIENLTKNQSESPLWYDYRKGRITGSSFHDVVLKVENNFTIRNPNKMKTVLSKVCGYSKIFSSKATEWGKENEPVARDIYVKVNKEMHKNLKVSTSGFIISQETPFFGASPDGIVSCECHLPRLIEIKCPWNHRGFNVADYANTKYSCLEVCSNGKLRLKRNHSYFYQIQFLLGVTKYESCDFFLCTTKNYFQEKIYLDVEFWENAKKKAEYFYHNVILKELFNKNIEPNQS